MLFNEIRPLDAPGLNKMLRQFEEHLDDLHASAKIGYYVGKGMLECCNLFREWYL